MLENPVAAMLRSMVVEKEDISSGLYAVMSADAILLAPDMFVYKHFYDCFARIGIHIILPMHCGKVQQMWHIKRVCLFVVQILSQ